VLADDFERVVRKLELLQHYGVQTAVDNFGVGYLSFSRLGKLPVHTVKIDKSLIGGMLKEEAGGIVVESMIAMLGRLGYETMAEGVEHQNQLDRLKKIGFRIMFLSNNNEKRVVRFNQKIGADYIFKAGKPSKKSYLRAMQRMGTTKENTVFIGDQLFTDILGAKRAGIYTYLVRPIAAHEEIQIVLKRKLERIVLFFYWRKNNLIFSSYFFIWLCREKRE